LTCWYLAACKMRKIERIFLLLPLVKGQPHGRKSSSHLWRNIATVECRVKHCKRV
jgi:hypothetical protein